MSAQQTLLLTGGAGFIGANFARLVLRETTHTIIILDALTYSGNLDNLAGLEQEYQSRFTFVRGNICDRDTVNALLRKHTPNAIVHMAAESHVDRSIIDATPFVRSNVLGTQTLLDAVRIFTADTKHPVRFVHVSTDEVYGSLPIDRPDLKFTEYSPIAPNSPYAASKAASDLLVLASHHTHGVDAVVTRCSNNFGPYQFPEKVIPLFATNLFENKTIPLYGDGLNIRDWIHVDDHNTGVLAALDRGIPGEVYNLGGNNEISNLELTHAILDCFDLGAEMIERVADRPGHDRRYAIDASKAKSELGWSPTRSAWPGSLRETVDWYRTNAPWWQAVKSGAYLEYYQQQYGPR